MVSIGVHRRADRLHGPGGRSFFLALDHGLPAGPIPGLEDPARLVASMSRVPLTGVIVNPGLVRFLPSPSPPVIVHLSAGTMLGAHPTSKVLATTPDRACALGADAVSLQIHFGDPAEDRMVAAAGAAVEAADRLGLPTVVMAYPPSNRTGDVDAVRHATRAAAELGASMVQAPYTGSSDTFLEVVRGCPVPVIVTGGPRASSTDAFLDAVAGAMAAGAGGLSAGRNVFQAAHPADVATRAARLVFAEASAPMARVVTP